MTEEVNDIAPTYEPQNEIVDDLKRIVAAFQAPGLSFSKACEIVAKRLSFYSSPKRQWCGRYVRQVISGSLKPSRHLTLAVQFEIAKLDVRQGFEVELEKVEVLAPVGRIPPNTLLLLRPKMCPSCGGAFFANSPRQILCAYCRYQKERKASAAYGEGWTGTDTKIR